MRLFIALAASAAAHGALVLAAWRLAPVPQPVVPPVPVMATRVGLKFSLPKGAPGHSERRAEKKATRRAVATTTSVAIAAEIPSAEIGEEPQAVGADSTAVDSPPAALPLPAGERGRSFDVSALHLALAESARRCYPPAAKRFHLTGEAQVDFCLDGAGALQSTKLASSTGQSMLDAAARECVIAGAMPMPQQAAGGCYSVPIRFR